MIISRRGFTKTAAASLASLALPSLITRASAADSNAKVGDHLVVYTGTGLQTTLADKLVEPEGCERFANRAPSKVVTSKAYPKIAHSFLHEPERAEVYDDITRWLGQQFAE